MRFNTVPVVAAMLCGACSAQNIVTAPYAPDSGSITIRCGILVDGIADQPLTFQTIEIENGRITSIGYSDEEVDLDLSRDTCMPGFIDTHTHIADLGMSANESIYYTIGDGELDEAGRKNAEITLASGVTTARDVGAYVGWSGSRLKQRIDRGEIVGPRMQVAPFYLTIPRGGGDLYIPGHDESEIPPRLRLGVARGPEAFRGRAQEAIDGGADFLKIIASGAVLSYGGVPGAPEMTPEEIKAVVDVASAAGKKVTAHAHGAQSIKDAILAGVDSIEHASLADDEAIRLAVEHGVAFSMDVYNGDYIATVGREEGWAEEFIRKGDETTEAQRQVFTKAHEAGVIITFGTDAGVYPHGDAAKQFPIMVQRGMTPMEAIRAATSVAARVIGWEQDVGALEPGRYGDLIAVPGDPLSDVSLLEDVHVVVKGGLVFKNTSPK